MKRWAAARVVKTGTARLWTIAITPTRRPTARRSTSCLPRFPDGTYAFSAICWKWEETLELHRSVDRRRRGALSCDYAGGLAKYIAEARGQPARITPKPRAAAAALPERCCMKEATWKGASKPPARIRGNIGAVKRL